MTKNDLHQRGVDAAKAFCERIGMTPALGRDSIVTGGFYMNDGDELVLVRAHTTRTASTKDPKVPRTLISVAEGAGADRIDLVELRIIAADRALLRHYRAAWTPERKPAPCPWVTRGTVDCAEHGPADCDGARCGVAREAVTA